MNLVLYDFFVHGVWMFSWLMNRVLYDFFVHECNRAACGKLCPVAVPPLLLSRGTRAQLFFCVTCKCGPLTISAFDKRPQRKAMHVGHSRLEIFHHTAELQPSVRVSEMARFIGTEVEHIQTYVKSKQQPILFLTPPAASTSSITEMLSCCLGCGRALSSPEFSYCCLQCKFTWPVALIRQEEEEEDEEEIELYERVSAKGPIALIQQEEEDEEEIELYERISASLTPQERSDRFNAIMKRGCKCANGDSDCNGRPVVRQSGPNL